MARELLESGWGPEICRVSKRRYIETAPRSRRWRIASTSGQPKRSILGRLCSRTWNSVRRERAIARRRAASADCLPLSGLVRLTRPCGGLGAPVDEHYRNANVRVAVAAAFLNRFVPQPATQVAPFRDTIVGADVTGRSTTLAKLTVLLVPDRHRLRLGLEANGVVNSNTAATSGPATFYNNGQSQFVVRKLFLCDTHRLNVFPAVAEAAARRQRSRIGRSRLTTACRRWSDRWCGSIARSQHEERQDQARWETEQSSG